jgi:hypothetical protein
VFAWLETLDRREDRYPAGPEGMVLYAVGDIHGRSDCLKRAHDLIDRDVAERSARDRALEIYVGDYVDRGSDSKGVIDILIARSLSASAVFLRGNHEIVMESSTARRKNGTHFCLCQAVRGLPVLVQRNGLARVSLK